MKTTLLMLHREMEILCSHLQKKYYNPDYKHLETYPLNADLKNYLTLGIYYPQFTPRYRVECLAGTNPLGDNMYGPAEMYHILLSVNKAFDYYKLSPGIEVAALNLEEMNP